MYKKVIKRGGNRYTYYYHNQRVNGKVRNICLGNNLEEARRKLKTHTPTRLTHKPRLHSKPSFLLHHARLLNEVPALKTKHPTSTIKKFLLITATILFTLGFLYASNSFNRPITGLLLGEVIKSDTLGVFGVSQVYEQQNNADNIIFKINKAITGILNPESITHLTGHIVYGSTDLNLQVNQEVSDQAYVLLNFEGTDHTRSITEFSIPPTQNNTYSLGIIDIDLSDFGINAQALEPGTYQVILSLIDQGNIIRLTTKEITISQQPTDITQPQNTTTPEENITTPVTLPANITEPQPPEQNQTNLTITPAPINLTLPSEPTPPQPTNITEPINQTPTPQQPVIPPQEPATNLTFSACNISSDCGTNYYTGDLYCFGEKTVIRDRIIHYCPSNHTCSQATTQTINQTCSTNQTCYQGDCFYDWEIPAINQTNLTQPLQNITASNLTYSSQRAFVDFGFDPWNTDEDAIIELEQEDFEKLIQIAEQGITPLTKVIINKEVPVVERIFAKTGQELQLELPPLADNITIYKISESTKQGKKQRHNIITDTWFKKDKQSKETKLPDKKAGNQQTQIITAQVIAESEYNQETFLNNLRIFFKTLFSSSSILSANKNPTGYITFDNQAQDNYTLRIEKTKQGELIEVYYTLPGPEQTEQDITANRKKIIINSTIHYEDVTSYLRLKDPSVTLDRDLVLYYVINGTKIPVSYTSIDTDHNNIIDYIEWEIPHLSEQEYELELIILNVQTYPVIGGKWEIGFNTSGAADLTISAVQETTYSEVLNDDNQTEDDLEILKLRCGEDTIFDKEESTYLDNVYFILNDNTTITPNQAEGQSLPVRSLFIQNYSCDDNIGSFTTGVITKGDHYQQFTFGNLTAYAQNDAGTWWNSSFRKCKDITIRNMGASTLLNFPAYINLSYDADMLTTFNDTRFVSTDCNNGGSLLDYEFENYTGSTNAHIWVRIPSLPSAGTTISVYYANESEPQRGNATATWDPHFRTVQHLQETSGTHFDSTNYGNDGTNNAVQNAKGYIDGADDFGGYVSLGSASTLNCADNITIEAWIERDWTGVAHTIYISKDYNDASYGLQFGVNDADKLQTWQAGGGTVPAADTGITTAFTHVAFTYLPDGTYNYYRNGKNDGSGIYDRTMTYGTALIGRLDSTTTLEAFDGVIDEFRISCIDRSADWINQTYSMAYNNTYAITIGSTEESIECAHDYECAATAECLNNYCFEREGRFVIQNSTGDNLTIIDKYGQVAFRGSWVPSCTTPAAAGSFQIQNSTNDVIYWISPQNGSVCSNAILPGYTGDLGNVGAGGLDGANTCASNNATRIQNQTNNVSCFTDKGGIGWFYATKNIILNADEI